MASQIQICNLALRHIAEQPINALDEGSEPPNVLSDIFDLVYKEELRGYPWRWASTTAELSEISSETPPDFAYVHQLPADYLQMQKILDLVTGQSLFNIWDEYYGKYTLRQNEYEVREGKLYSNWSDIYIKYTKLITDYSKLDPSFVVALSWRLAFEIGPSITARDELVERAYRYYQIEINKARGNSGNEQRRMLDISREYLGARNHTIR